MHRANQHPTASSSNDLISKHFSDDQTGQPHSNGRIGTMQKRISLPENLQFQPQKLLNLKQSLQVEEQMSQAAEDGEQRSSHRIRTVQLFKAHAHPRQQVHFSWFCTSLKVYV